MGKHTRGFTLIELLVAISILALVAVLGWRGLDSIVRARVALTRDLDQTRGMQLTFAQLQSDCDHIAPASMIPQHPQLLVSDGRLVMVRQVFADNQPSRVEVVAYRLRDGMLTRHESNATRDLSELDTFWQAAITDADAAGAVVLQSGLSGMAVRIWSSDSPGWRVSTDTAMQTSAIAGGPVLIGLEMALQAQGQQASMTKSFLLGPV